MIHGWHDHAIPVGWPSDVSGRPAAAASDAAGLAAMFETAAPGGTKIIRYLHLKALAYPLVISYSY